MKCKKVPQILEIGFFLSKFYFYYIVIFSDILYNSDRGDYYAYNNIKIKKFRAFYITQSYTNANGKSTSKTIRKLGTLAELSAQLHTDRDGVVEWANEQARLETLKYKSEKEDATVMIPFHSNRLMDYHKQKLFSGGYLFLQSIYYGLKLDSVCRKIKSRHKFEYDLNAILSDLIYTRVLEPSSKVLLEQQNSSLSLQLMNFMMCTELFLFLLLKWILFNQKFIKIAFFSVTEWIGFFIMIAQTTTLKSNRKMVIKNTEKAKNIVRIPLFKWDFLQMVTEYLLAFSLFPGKPK